MNHMSWLNGFWFQFTQSRLNLLRDISTFIAFLINIVLLSTVRRAVEGNQSVIKTIFIYGLYDSHYIIIGLGLMQIVSSVALFVVYNVINAPLILKESWRKLVEQNKG